MHGSGEESHGSAETVAAKPAQHLLRAVSKKNNAQGHSQDSRCDILVCGNKFSKHRTFSFFSHLPYGFGFCAPLTLAYHKWLGTAGRRAFCAAGIDIFFRAINRDKILIFADHGIPEAPLNPPCPWMGAEAENSPGNGMAGQPL
jgi:hypothetical protein